MAAITPPPAGRFLIAFDDPTLTWSPTWTRLDSNPSLVASYTIDRGRQFELDRTDTGRATVTITDRDGTLDPTNPGGPYYGKLEPLLQAMIGRYNPMDAAWHTRFRGFIEDFDYGFDPSQRVNRLQVSLVDLFEILSAVEMQDELFSGADTSRPTESNGQVWLAAADMKPRIDYILDCAHIPAGFRVVFTGNVNLWETVYSPGETPLTAIQEAADGEFPTVSNCYCDRRGRFCVHGRLAKFDPVGVASGVDADTWDFVEWKAGDSAAVAADAAHTAQIREFAFNRGLSKILNSAFATPTRASAPNPLTAAQIHGQLVKSDASIGRYGIRSWDAQDLLTKKGLLSDPDSSDLAETRLFAQYIVDNYSAPQNRVTVIGFRTMQPASAGAGKLWDLLSRVDIGDGVDVTVASPGGGGFDATTSEAKFFVEGVHEEARPLTPGYDDVTLRLDLSPRAYFVLNPFPT
jgi:hypothetical protein